MNSAEIMAQVNKIFIDVLDNESVVLKRETTAKDVEDWDSLNHIRLMIEIENEFQIKFLTMELFCIKNVGEIIALICKKSCT